MKDAIVNVVIIVNNACFAADAEVTEISVVTEFVPHAIVTLVVIVNTASYAADSDVTVNYAFIPFVTHACAVIVDGKDGPGQQKVVPRCLYEIRWIPKEKYRCSIEGVDA